MAATLRGWVQAICFPPLEYPASDMNCAIWVVFPEPVSPTRMVVWFELMISTKSLRACQTGSPARFQNYENQTLV